MVFVVRRRNDLLERVVPFFEAQPLLSSKQVDFLIFAQVVRAMSEKKHLTDEGFETLLGLALSMNGAGRYRRVYEAGSVLRILRDHTPKAAGDCGEDMVRPAWRHAEPGRNDLAPEQTDGLPGGNKSVGPYPVQP